MKNKIVIFLYCLLLITTFAEHRISWYPDNSDEISKKCYEENHLPANLQKSLENNELLDDPKVRAVLLCQAKAINVYSEQTGFDALRLTQIYYTGTRNPERRKHLVENCFNNHKSIVSPGEKFFKVIQCLDEMEQHDTVFHIQGF